MTLLAPEIERREVGVIGPVNQDSSGELHRHMQYHRPALLRHARSCDTNGRISEQTRQSHIIRPVFLLDVMEDDGRTSIDQSPTHSLRAGVISRTCGGSGELHHLID
jgi:hypothetical protein